MNTAFSLACLAAIATAIKQVEVTAPIESLLPSAPVHAPIADLAKPVGVIPDVAKPSSESLELEGTTSESAGCCYDTNCDCHLSGDAYGCGSGRTAEYNAGSLAYTAAHND